jgi:hypothetical protein
MAMTESNVRPIKSAFQSGEIIDIIRRLDGIKIDPVRLHYYEKTGLIKASVRPAQGCGKHKLYSFSDPGHAALVSAIAEAGAEYAEGTPWYPVSA